VAALPGTLQDSADRPEGAGSSTPPDEADQQIEESKLVQAVSYVSLGSKRSVAGGFPGAAAVRGAFEPSLLARDRLYHRGHVPTAPVHVVPAGFE